MRTLGMRAKHLTPSNKRESLKENLGQERPGSGSREERLSLATHHQCQHCQQQRRQFQQQPIQHQNKQPNIQQEGWDTQQSSHLLIQQKQLNQHPYHIQDQYHQQLTTGSKKDTCGRGYMSNHNMTSTFHNKQTMAQTSQGSQQNEQQWWGQPTEHGGTE